MSRRDKRAAFLLAAMALAVFAAGEAAAQGISLSFDSEASLTKTSIQLLILITVLSIVPGLAVMITSFPFVVTVLSILRQALGLQQSPPNILIISLALFLTYFVMEPVFLAAWENGINPLLRGEMELEPALSAALAPFRTFMAARTDAETFLSLASLRQPGVDASALGPDARLSLLIPSFMLSEIERAFQIGFLIFLPFLIIDLVVAAVLMSMGMMMVPPAIVSLPFKLAFFVVADGWMLISGALVRSYF